MDKVSRVLILYSRLINGEIINKLAFCEEFEYNSRSFDRDIEDVRLFLSESYSAKELLYNRSENCYYLSGEKRVELELVEYSIIERILIDSGTLRKDELSQLLAHLATNTERTHTLQQGTSQLLETYAEPAHGKSLLKIYGDLTIVIKNKSVIKIKYKSESEYEYIEIIPFRIFYRDKHFYLYAFDLSHKSDELKTYRLDKIDSFEVLRRQTSKELAKTTLYYKTNHEC